MDLPMVAWAVMYEEAARSLFGPLAMNCMAPDDGNMNVLEKARHAGAEGKMAAPDRRGQGALVVRHDRAGARRRLRSEHDARPTPRSTATPGKSTAASGSSPAPTAPRISSWRRAPPTTSARASPRSCFTRTSPAGASCAASRSWGRRSTAAIASSSSTASKCTTTTCSAASATGSRWCRCGSARRGSPTACAGSAGRSAAWRSRRSTSAAARASASSSPTARACR